MRNVFTIAGVALLAVVAYLTLFWRLGAAPLHVDPVDESVHTGVTLEMARTGSLVPTYHGRFYMGKPPLKMWLTARLVNVLGASETVLRFPDATCALLTGLLIAWLARRSYGPAAALIAPVALWTSPFFILFHGAREGVQDSPVTFFVSAAVAAWALAVERGGAWLLLPGLAMSAAVCVKAVVGMLPFAVGGGLIVLRRRLALLKSPWLYVGALLPLVSYVLYHALAPKQTTLGLEPALGELSSHFLKRATAWKSHRQPVWMYLPWLRAGMELWVWPAAAGLVLAAGSAWRRVRRPAESTTGAAALDLVVVLWLLGILLPFSASVSKLAWYTYPMYPAVALLAARALAPPELASPRTRAALLLVAAVVGAVQLRRIVLEVAEERPLPSRDLFRVLEGPAEAPLHVFGIPLDDLCPDEEFYAGRSRLGLVPVKSEAELVMLLAGGEASIIMIDAELEHLAAAYPAELACYRAAALPARCDAGGENEKRLAPRRVLLAPDRPGLPATFQPISSLAFRNGFYASEPSPETGAMRWLSTSGEVKVGTAGRRRIALLARSFVKPRRLVVSASERPILDVVVGEAWSELVTAPFEAGSEGLTLRFESAEGCDEVRRVVPTSGDARCLSIALSAVREVPPEGEVSPAGAPAGGAPAPRDDDGNDAGGGDR